MAGLQDNNLSFAELYRQAERSMPLLQQQGDQILDDLRKKHPGVFDDVKFELAALKDERRAQDKIKTDYAGDHSRIADLARGRFVVTKPEQVEIMRDYFAQQRDGFKVEVNKDRFAKPSDTNFRDINMQVRLGNGHVTEVRVEHQDIVAAGKRTHVPYTEVQDIERRAQAENRMMTPEEARRRQFILDYARDEHGEAASRAGMDRLLSEEGRKKVAGFEADRLPSPANADNHKIAVGKIEHKAGRTAGVAGVAMDVAAGNYGSAAAGAAMEVATSDTALKGAAKIGAAGAQFAKRIPVIGAAVTAGFVAYEVGKHALNGEGKKAMAAAAAGSAEIAGNAVGFGVGDAAREAVREGVIAVGGKKYEDIEKSGLRQLGEKGMELASKFNASSPGTPAQIAEMQANMLGKAGLDSIEKDGKKVNVAELLRDPKQRTAFIESLEKSAASAGNPDTKSAINSMVAASKSFVEMEDRKTALQTAQNDPSAAPQAAPGAHTQRVATPAMA